MKKIVYLQAFICVCLLFCGCNSAQDKEAVSVVEIPIEEDYNNEESTENTVADAFSVTEEIETEQFEDIEVEVNGDKGSILVGTTGAPFTEILTQAKIQLAADGWDLQIKYYDNYEQMNADVLSGALDAHLFAHQTYIDSYNDVNGTNFVPVAPVCYEVYGIYSKLNKDLTAITGATVALPKEAEKKARALLFMQDIGWITLKENVGMTAITEDIIENNKNLQFTEYTTESLQEVLEGCGYGIVGSDTAIVNGFDVEDDVIRAEDWNSLSAQLYATKLVTVQERADDTKLKVLADVFSTDIMKEYVDDAYRGALGLME